MKIAVIGNFDKEITPNSSGGTELFTYLLVEELAKRKSIEAIDVYGVGKNHFSQKRINFISNLPCSVGEFVNQDPVLTEISNLRPGFVTDLQSNIALKSFSEFSRKTYDIIHNNSTSSIINTVMQYISGPTVTTVHTNIESPSIIIPYKLNILQKKINNYFVTIANHQQAYAKKNNINLNIIGTVYNGIDIHNFSYSDQTSNQAYGMWIGRINRKHNKGLKEALIVSKNVAKKLIVLTSIDDQVYYKEAIKPYLNPNVDFIEKNVSLLKKIEYYENASYLLYPIMWEEPFGLVFIEAMASGTPVIAFARGAVPEIVVDGVTGFIVNPSEDDIRGKWVIKKTGIEGLCEAVERISNLQKDDYEKMRQACRKHVEENFTVEKMVDGYEKVYKEIIEASR